MMELKSKQTTNVDLNLKYLNPSRKEYRVLRKSVYPMESEIDLSACCRACLRTDCDLIPLNAEDEDSLRFSFKLVSCISEIAWLQDNCSTAICDYCVEQLRISFDFRTTCLSTDEKLQNQYAKPNKIESKDILYEYIETSTKVDSLINSPIEGGNNSESYIQLTHFSDSDEELIKNGYVDSDNGLSRCSSPEFNATTEIEAQDIKEEIIDNDELEEDNKSILSRWKENIQGLKITDGNSGLLSVQKENRKTDKIKTGTQVNVVITKENRSENCEACTALRDGSVVTHYGNVQSKPFLDSDQAPPAEVYSGTMDPKAPIDTDIQINPPNRNSCNVCGNTYMTKATLKMHMRRHTGEMPFKCKLCGKSFCYSSHLKEHVRTHRKEKPNKCRFATENELKIHMKSHTEEKLYTCSICEHGSPDQKNNMDEKNNQNDAKDRPHIKKPLNAFMLYMKEVRAKVMAECNSKESAAINQILGRKWHTLSREEQAKYYELARYEKQLHMKLHPEWSNRPVIRSKKRRRNKQEKQDRCKNMKCRARYGVNQQSQWCEPCRRKKKCIRYMESVENNDADQSGNRERLSQWITNPSGLPSVLSSITSRSVSPNMRQSALAPDDTCDVKRPPSQLIHLAPSNPVDTNSQNVSIPSSENQVTGQCVGNDSPETSGNEETVQSIINS